MEVDLSKLDESIRRRLIKARLTTAYAILSLTDDELRDVANLYSSEVETVCDLASETVALNVTSCTTVEMLSTGCKAIDTILHGGLIRGAGITEISGESGSGKTQLCLQLSLLVQNSEDNGGFDKGVIYLCTEDCFPSKRLEQMVKYICPPFATANQLRYADNIFVAHVPTTENLKQNLENNVQSLINSDKIGLLVIDSIAAVFRADFSNEQFTERAKELRLIGNKLHQLAAKYNICIVCINQVTTSFTDQSNFRGELIPALGLVWSNLVTTRLFVKKVEFSDGIRELQVQFSPHVPPSSCYFTIDSRGISDCTVREGII